MTTTAKNPQRSAEHQCLPQEGLRESNNLRFEELRETNAELSALQAAVRCTGTVVWLRGQGQPPWWRPRVEFPADTGELVVKTGESWFIDGLFICVDLR